MATTWFGYGFNPNEYKAPSGEKKESGGGKQDAYNRWRFYVKVGEERTIMFLNNLHDGFKLTEHSAYNPDERKVVNFPCLKYGKDGATAPCWLCDNGSRPYQELVLSIIDKTGYVGKHGENAGKLIQNVKKLFVIPYAKIDLFMRKEAILKQQGNEGLKFQEFQVLRTTKQTSSLGEDFTVIRKVAAEELSKLKIDATPFNCAEIVPFSTTTFESQKQFFMENPGYAYKPKAKTVAFVPVTQAPAAAADDSIHYDSTESTTDGLPPF